MFVLALLSVFTIIADYLAIVSYSSLQEASASNFEFRLPFFLIMKLTLTPLMTHLFSALILKRFFMNKSLMYFLVAIGGLFVYEFTVFDRSQGSTSYSVSASVLGGFKLMIPTIYTLTHGTSNSVYFFQWIPHFLVFFSSVCNGLIPVLSKSFMIKHAHHLKLSQYQQ